MIEVELHGNVRELRLARPPVNALNRELLTALDRELDAVARAGDGVRALVLSGQPGLFCAGLDVAELAGLDTPGVREFTEQFFSLQRRLALSALPIVAAITGHSPAGGTVLALYCDYRVMARGAYRIGLNEVQVGLYAGRRIFRAYAWLIGEGRAAGLLARGAMVEPQRAYEIGLVDELAEPDAVRARALAVAAELAALPSQTQARTRALVREGLVAALDSPDQMGDSSDGAGWITAETGASFARILKRRREG